MVRYIFKRLLYMVVTLFVIITLTFISMKAIPGDPIAAKYEKASPEVRSRIEAVYGLDKPKTKQYIIYLKNVLQGNLGLSIMQPGKTANDIIAQSAPASARLGATALVWGLAVGVLCGFFAGMGLWGECLCYTGSGGAEFRSGFPAAIYVYLQAPAVSANRMGDGRKLAVRKPLCCPSGSRAGIQYGGCLCKIYERVRHRCDG